jgi:S-adenosylmethionine/arginine decarboxylase-like enzyme
MELGVGFTYGRQPYSGMRAQWNSTMHKHLIVTGKTASPTKDPSVIERFLNDLVELVDMKVFMPARAKYCDDELNSGVTGDIVITTSHSSIHLWDNAVGNPYPGLLQFDLYSCKDYNPDDVIKFIQATFDAEITSFQVIER